MRQLTHKRLSAWLLTLIMLVGMLPAMASADEVDEDLSPPAPQEDYGIGDDTQPRGRMRVPVAPTANGNYPSGVFLPNGTTNDGIYLFNGECLQNNSDTSSIPYTSGMSYVARYDETTGTLYLNGYEGVANIYAGIGTRYSGVLTIEVERDSTITVKGTGERLERRGIDAPGRLVISGNGKLTINVTCSGDGYGIYARYGMEITAPLKVNVSVNAPTDDKVAYGLYAYSGDISLSGGDKTIRVGSKKTANGIFNCITETGQNIIKGNVTLVQTSGEGGSGIFSGSGPVTLDNATVNISGNFSNGILTRCANKSENITIKNHSDVTINLPDGANNNGLCIYGNGSEKNLTISDSTVNIRTRESPVFVNGTGSSVSIKDSIVDLTKTADGHPVISTKTGSQNSIDLTNSGRVTMTATGNQEYPLFPNLSTITPNTKCTVGTYMDQWTNYAGEYNSSTGTTVLEFVHHESDRRVMLENIIIAGQTNVMLSNEIPDFKLTLQDDFFSDKVRPYIMVNEWFSNRPDGVEFQIRAVDKVATPNTATIQVCGTPTVPCIEPIKVAIPGEYLRSGNPIAASAPNSNARFDIKQTLTESVATITPPVVGQTAGESNAVTSGDPEKYTVTVDHWEKSGNGSMSSTDVFQANQGYYCFLKVTPQPGYAFDRGAGCSVNNGSSTATFSPDNNGLYQVPINPCQSAISLDVSGTVDLENKKPGDIFPTKDIAVTNLLSSAINNIPVTLSDSTHFKVNSANIASIPANGTGTFTISPAANLEPGDYATKVTVGGGSLGVEQFFYVEFSVRKVVPLTVNTLAYNGELQIGVTADEKIVSISGNRQRDAGNYTATAYLKDTDYMWPDYTTDSTMDISWSIGKRDPKIEDFEITLPDERTEYEIEFGTDGPYATYDGTAKTATATLKTKYSGCGDITVKYRKFVSTGRYATLDEAVDAGMYDVLVYVAAGGSNFNAASALVYNTSFLIKPVPLSMPQLTVKAPTTSGGMGKIVGTTTQMQYAPKGTTNWKPCSNGETSVMPGTYYLYLKADSTDTNHTDSSYAEVTVPKYGAGVTVSGTIKSYNPGNATTIQLMQGGKEQYKTTIAAATGNGQKEQNFSFDAVAAGTYDLVVTKPGHLTYTVKGIAVEDTAIDLTKHSNAAIRMITLLAGDVNGDDMINNLDYAEVMAPSNFNKSYTAPSDVGNALADVDGDGMINNLDYALILDPAHFNKTTSACTVTY